MSKRGRPGPKRPPRREPPANETPLLAAVRRLLSDHPHLRLDQVGATVIVMHGKRRIAQIGDRGLRMPPSEQWEGLWITRSDDRREIQGRIAVAIRRQTIDPRLERWRSELAARGVPTTVNDDRVFVADWGFLPLPRPEENLALVASRFVRSRTREAMRWIEPHIARALAPSDVRCIEGNDGYVVWRDDHRVGTVTRYSVTLADDSRILGDLRAEQRGIEALAKSIPAATEPAPRTPGTVAEPLRLAEIDDIVRYFEEAGMSVERDGTQITVEGHGMRPAASTLASGAHIMDWLDAQVAEHFLADLQAMVESEIAAWPSLRVAMTDDAATVIDPAGRCVATVTATRLAETGTAGNFLVT